MTNPDIIFAPVVTEKSATNAQKGIYTFKVDKRATKTHQNTTTNNPQISIQNLHQQRQGKSHERRGRDKNNQPGEP